VVKPGESYSESNSCKSGGKSPSFSQEKDDHGNVSCADETQLTLLCRSLQSCFLIVL
jgi:hypothetical protein